MPLPPPFKARVDVPHLGSASLQTITRSIVSGFKGLENDVVILAALTDIETDWHRGVAYVGRMRKQQPPRDRSYTCSNTRAVLRMVKQAQSRGPQKLAEVAQELPRLALSPRCGG